MIDYKQAQQMLRKHAQSFGTEKVKLAESLGRVLASNISAPRDLPPFNRAAVDGYAIQIADFEQGKLVFEVVETIFAGKKPKEELKSGQCYKIMTGAAVPDTANAIVKLEDTVESNGIVAIKSERCLRSQNIATKGQDLKEADLVLSANLKINPSTIGLLAAMGQHEVLVQKHPKVAIITTGDEVMPIDGSVDDFQIYNSNMSLLTASLAQLGMRQVQSEHVGDCPLALEKSITDQADADLFILTGGVSVGEADYVPAVLESIGAKILFHKVAIKPGKPVICALNAKDGVIFALPGNPFSCLVTFKLFVEHYLNACFQLVTPSPALLPVNFNRTKRTDFDEFFPVAVIEGCRELEATPLNGSGDIRLLAFSNALAIQPASKKQVSIGDKLSYLRIH